MFNALSGIKLGGGTCATHSAVASLLALCTKSLPDRVEAITMSNNHGVSHTLVVLNRSTNSDLSDVSSWGKHRKTNSVIIIDTWSEEEAIYSLGNLPKIMIQVEWTRWNTIEPALPSLPGAPNGLEKALSRLYRKTSIYILTNFFSNKKPLEKAFSRHCDLEVLADNLSNSLRIK